ncbi:redoxin family protein [Chitinophaga oryziterrae]|uniref:Redoxin family protein n=1 Tax=Chitinophaga oryziterrae TaxID=1031224 RepID=A0A6N8JK89_9BACT|nr:TlpA family protein disulfide reductase [Chitinophaga oryziterrae]MVT44668.1 redoxin family protein [Chitinophaga oryziterrae]
MKLLTVLILMIGLSGCFAKERTTTGEWVGTKMPAFNLLLSDSTTYLSTQNIPAGKPVLFFYFATYCPYCRAQLEDIIKDINKFKDTHIYMVTNSPYSEVKDYMKEFKLDKYPNITMNLDYKNFFIDSFKVKGVPFMAVYNGDKKLQETFSGKVPTSDLLSNLDN